MQNRSKAKKAPSAQPGSDIRHRVEAVGVALGQDLDRVLGGLPRRPSGPQSLATHLGITIVTASRLLKALDQKDPVATLQMLPGPRPLQQFLDAAANQGVDRKIVETAGRSVSAFDDLIREAAGDRSSFKAMLTTWLPEVRRVFEAERRQSVFKAMFELEGVSSELEIDTMILRPGSQAGRLDIVVTKCLLGIDRIRPDAVVKLGTVRTDRLPSPGVNLPAGAEDPRGPTNLEGVPALDGLEDIRLNQFCNSPPAPLLAESFGSRVQYSLGPTGFGPASKVDLVVSEVNRNELHDRQPNTDTPPFFYSIPELASRRMVFDLIVHPDVYAGTGPRLMIYDTAGRGPASACDPTRALDLRRSSHEVQVLGSGLHRMRLKEYPRYVELQQYTFDKLGWAPAEFRAFRVAIQYPLGSNQVTLAFVGS